MLTRYQTITEPGRAEYEIQKSLFIAYAAPIGTEEAAREFIHCIKKQDYSATHHCFAYVIGLDDAIQKADDDGEPSGTAGRPILEVLKKHAIKNSIIVVTRYFGGIKLGAGGLTRAYGKSAALGLDKAGITTFVFTKKYQIHVSYTLQGPLENQLIRSGFSIISRDFTNQAVFTVLILPEKQDELFRLVQEITHGEAHIEACGHDYCRSEE